MRIGKQTSGPREARRRFAVLAGELYEQHASTWQEVRIELAGCGFGEPDTSRLITENWVAVETDPEHLSLHLHPAAPGHVLVPKGAARRVSRLLRELPAAAPAGSLRMPLGARLRSQRVRSA